MIMQAPQKHRGMLPERDGTSAVPAYGPLGVYDSGVSLKDLLGIVRRRRVIILLTVCAITGLAALLAFQLTPRYTATADVMIKPRQVRVIDLESVVSELPPDRALIETELDLLRSHHHAQRVIEEMELLSDAEFNPLIQPENVPPSLLAGLTSWLSRNWLTPVSAASQLFAYPPIHEIERADEIEDPDSYGYDRQMAVAVDRLLLSLNVSQKGDSQVISIDFTSTDPAKAARIANAVAELYVAGQRQDKLAATQEAATWLADRVEQLRRSVLKSEAAIEEYRAANKWSALSKCRLANRSWRT